MPRNQELQQEELQSALERVKVYATDTYEKISQSTMEKAKTVDETVKHHPWKSVGVAAVAGAAVGAFLRNKK